MSDEFKNHVVCSIRPPAEDFVRGAKSLKVFLTCLSSLFKHVFVVVGGAFRLQMCSIVRK